jgi:hypothetical protein
MHHRQGIPLVVDRDVNAARVLTAKGVVQLVPASVVHPRQLHQLRLCVDRSTRQDWLQQKKAAAGAEQGG